MATYAELFDIANNNTLLVTFLFGGLYAWA